MFNTKKSLQIIKDARDLINDKNKWTQDAFARDEEYKRVPISSSEAVCWCAVGALRKVARENNTYSTPYIEASEFLLKEANELSRYYTVSQFNDKNNYKTVMDTFDKAINKLSYGRE